MQRLITVLFLAHWMVLSAAGPSDPPMLRVEAGMHTGDVDGISVDAAGRLALTCGADKTARLWLLPREGFAPVSATLPTPSPILQRVLRPPVGDDNDGALHASALSPDGSLAAVSGIKKDFFGPQFSLYIFRTDTGALVRQINNFRSSINALAFSSRGDYLAGVLGSSPLVGGGAGVRIWETASGREVASDLDYSPSDGSGLDWHGDSKLVTISLYDSTLRLYQLGTGGLKRVTKVTCATGKNPVAVRFSPDGRRIAVGFYDTGKVAVHDGADLSRLFATEGPGSTTGSVSSVAWSADNSTLAAGGRWEADESIRIWPQAGRGQPRDFVAARDIVEGLCAMPSGDFLFASCEPSWGVLRRSQFGGANPPGKTSAAARTADALAVSPKPDFRGSTKAFRVSADGTTVAFPYRFRGQGTGLFSLKDRQLTAAQASGAPTESMLQRMLATAQLHAPKLTGLRITDWENSPGEAKLNGLPLTEDGRVYSRSLVIAGDASHFLMGTDIGLQCFESTGKPRWNVITPGGTLAVNFADGDRLAVAAQGDGTIRWYRASDGVQLLAFYAHADRKRWVLWAPYFGEIRRPWIGITTKDNSTTIEYDSNALRAAGLRKGDIITALDGQAVSTKDSIDEIVQRHAVGDRLRVAFTRGGSPMAGEVTLVEWLIPETLHLGDYYDCSPGGEELIGWHVNRIGAASDFFPAAKFRDTFYRPDVIARVLEMGDVVAAAKAADEAAGRKPQPLATADDVISKMQPPVVELLVGAASGEATVSGATFTVRYRVRSGGVEKVTRMRALLDGRPLPMELPVPGDGAAEVEASIAVPDRDCVLALLAENRFAISEPATLRLRRPLSANLPSPVAEPAAILKPKLYLFAAGISRYAKNDRFQNLQFAAKDARDFAGAFQRQDGGLYQKVEMRVLVDDGATAGDVLDGLDWIRKETTSKDVAVIFLSGHGENDEELRYYFCPHDYDHTRRLRTGVAMEEIQRTLSSIAGKVLFFIDSCHAGNALGKLFAAKGAGTQIDITRLVNELSSAENGAIVFASSTGRQISVESEEWQNSAFTKAIVEGLDGRADLLKNGKITVSSLETWIAERVKELSEGTQTPTVAKPQTVPDFPIGLKR